MKFILFSSLLLFWAFYEMSGGADFEAPKREAVAEVVTPAPVEPVEVPKASVVVDVVAPQPAPAAEKIAQVTQIAFVSTPEVMIIEAPAAEEASVATEYPVDDAVLKDLRRVAGDWVNMRDGPSTSFGILSTLPRGTEAEVIDVDASGWAKIRLTENGQTGWMSEKLLSDG